MKKSIFYLSVCGLAFGISNWAIAEQPIIHNDLNQAHTILVKNNGNNGVKRGQNQTPPGLSKQRKGRPNNSASDNNQSDNAHYRSRFSRFMDRFRTQD